MPAAVYVVDNPVRVRAAERIRAPHKHDAVWIACTERVEDARAVANVSGRWSRVDLAVGYTLDGQRVTGSLGEITTLIEARARALGVPILGLDPNHP
jgi:phosphoglycerate dehydrogenase-like enzyme